MAKKPKSRTRPSREPRRDGTPCRSPGPRPSITADVVQRVSERYARGLTLRLALAAEGNPKINEETWKKALSAHPELSPLYEAARGKFLEDSLRRLAASEDLRHLRWLLEKRYSDLFGPGADTVINVSQNVGIPEDVLRRAQEIANGQNSNSHLTPALSPSGEGEEKRRAK